jgi:hypothetical protein
VGDFLCVGVHFLEKTATFAERLRRIYMAAIKKDMVANRASSKKPRKKSKFTEFWEKYPHGILTIVDMRAVLK